MQHSHILPVNGVAVAQPVLCLHSLSTPQLVICGSLAGWCHMVLKDPSVVAIANEGLSDVPSSTGPW